jgi:spore coat polysaccharide biosynthesis protein SpsF
VTAVFLQVRLDSSRLPRKALADLGGQPVVVRCFQALDGVRADRRVLVTEPGSAPDLEPLARSCGWEVFVGSKDDVLDRFVQGARAHGADTVIRATGDNPLVSARLANLLADRHRERNSDYSGFLQGPVGSGVEVVRVAALEQAWASGPDAYEREHVAPFLYRRPGVFSIDQPDVPPPCRAPGARITLDTPEDLEYLRALWAAVYQGFPPEPEDLIPWLNQHPR